MAAGEDHSQLAVVYFAVVKKFVDRIGSARPARSPFPGESLPDFIATKRIQDLVLGDSVNPRGRVVGNAACLPRLQGLQ